MTFNEKEFHALIDDDHTVVNMTTNSTGNGGYVIVMNAFVRPTSALRDDYLNPHRNMGKIPVQYVRACPKCDAEWKSLTYDIKNDKMQSTHYHCCSNAICSKTYNKFVARGEKVDILHSQQDTMARGEEDEEFIFINEDQSEEFEFIFVGGEQ